MRFFVRVNNKIWYTSMPNCGRCISRVVLKWTWCNGRLAVIWAEWSQSNRLTTRRINRPWYWWR